MKKKAFDKNLELRRETLLALEDSTTEKALAAGPVTSACKSGWTCCQSTCF